MKTSQIIEIITITSKNHLVYLIFLFLDVASYITQLTLINTKNKTLSPSTVGITDT